MSPVEPILREVLQAVAWRDDVVTRVLDEFGPAHDESDHWRRQFHEQIRSAIEELQEQLGPTVDAQIAGKYGLEPERLLGPPPFVNPPSSIVAFAAWRTRDLWVFLAGRYCGSAIASHYVILIGATSQDSSVPDEQVA
jgi:hypothetical protein